MSVPTFGIALQVTERQQKTPLTLGRVELPPLGADELLLENHVAGQAAGDALCIDYNVMVHDIPWTNGWDCSGKILAVGADVKDFKAGDRVAGVGGSRPTARYGSYQQYVLLVDRGLAKIPDSLSYEEASTFPLAFATAFAGTFRLGIPASLDVEFPLPPQPDSVPPVLVWGASTNVGAVAVQFIKLAGYKVIGTASTKNFDYCKKIGCDYVVDYADSAKALQEIDQISKGKLHLVYNAISRGNSIEQSVKAIGKDGGIVVVNVPGGEKSDKHGRDSVEIFYAGGADIRGNPELHSSFKLLEKTLAKNLLIPHPIEVVPNGLLGVDEGWNRGRAGQVSASKLVYRIYETPGLPAP